MDAAQPITVLILSWNRPLYLWACLDSLYRYTRHNARFVIIDNGSSDPLVRRVIEGFQRRNMFAEIEWGAENSATRLFEVIRSRRPQLGKYFVYVEGDTAVYDTDPCWLTQMRDLMDRDDELVLLGSYVDKRDFIDPGRARHIAPFMSEEQFAGLIKAHSPERNLPEPFAPIIDPFNPPGRLLMFRTSALDRIQLSVDGELYQQVKALGLKAGIAAGIVHRHLSLLNFYDYPEYSVADRDAFMRNMTNAERARD